MREIIRKQRLLMKKLKKPWKNKVKSVLIWVMLISMIFNFVAYQPFLIAESYVDAMCLYDGFVRNNISKHALSELECCQLSKDLKNCWPYTVKITATSDKKYASVVCFVSVELFGIELVGVSSAIQPAPEYTVF